MLTGDKLETAKCIAISTGIKSPSQSFYEIISKDPKLIEQMVMKFKPEHHLIVVDGDTLDIIYRTP